MSSRLQGYRVSPQTSKVDHLVGVPVAGWVLVQDLMLSMLVLAQLLLVQVIVGSVRLHPPACQFVAGLWEQLRRFVLAWPLLATSLLDSRHLHTR